MENENGEKLYQKGSKWTSRKLELEWRYVGAKDSVLAKCENPTESPQLEDRYAAPQDNQCEWHIQVWEAALPPGPRLFGGKLHGQRKKTAFK